MMTVEFITALFYEVDEQLRALPKHPEARLWPSEVVTLGLLHRIFPPHFAARRTIAEGYLLFCSLM
jgi:hypothetical protein